MSLTKSVFIHLSMEKTIAAFCVARVAEYVLTGCDWAAHAKNSCHSSGPFEDLARTCVNQILRHLCAKHPERRLYPAMPALWATRSLWQLKTRRPELRAAFKSP